jgi:hypothetical protein
MAHNDKVAAVTLLLFLALGGVGFAEQAGEFAAVERAMAERPLDAFSIARKEVAGLELNMAQLKKLFTAAAAVQEKHLSLLSEAQLSELASVYTTTLGNAEAARRVQQNWLKQRERDLGAGNARGRCELAWKWWEWLKDSDQAARLSQEALRADPGLQGGEQLLRDQLGYRRTSRGWVRGDPEGKPFQPRVGMTAADIRDGLGLPQRKARQILDGHYLEQWSYEGQHLFLIEFDCRKGQEPRVLTVLSVQSVP